MLLIPSGISPRDPDLRENPECWDYSFGNPFMPKGLDLFCAPLDQGEMRRVQADLNSFLDVPELNVHTFGV